jgi:hypothetical protein
MGVEGEADVAGRDRAALAGATLEDLRKALAALPADVRPAAPEAGAVARRFEALFRLDAQAAARAPGLVRAEAPARGRLVVDALSLSRTPASQTALGAVAKDPAAPHVARSYAIQYLAQQDALPEPAVAAIAGLLDDPDRELRQMSRLTYGACARGLRATAPARAARITGELLTRLERAAEGTERADDRADFIVALGNAGDPAALPELRKIAEAGALRDRTQAIESLRFIDDPGVNPFLTALIRGSREEPIRLAVISAVRFRDVGPFAAALADVARKDPAPSVRNAAVSLLGDRLRALPTLRPILEEVQSHDEVAKNRELAARYLRL